MDIDLLSKMVSELILENDRVALPGLGEFVAQIVPSSITDKGYTINPPYRKLVFRPSKNDDGLLASLYAEANGTALDVASGVIREFVEGMKAVLKEQKVVVFPELGRLRATRENNVFFVADEDLDIFPECFGMEPVSLKSRRPAKIDFAEIDIASPETEPEPVPIPVAEAETVTEAISEPETEVEPTPAPEPETTAEAVSESELEERPRRGKGRKVLAGLAVAAGVIVLMLGVFVLVSRLAPDFVDRILYTPEELEIINYGK